MNKYVSTGENRPLLFLLRRQTHGERQVSGDDRGNNLTRVFFQTEPGYDAPQDIIIIAGS